MIIYYRHDFIGGREESHRLLRTAVGQYLKSEEEHRSVSPGMTEVICVPLSEEAAEDECFVRSAADLIVAMHTEGEFGKPVIDGFPDFSISHSNNSWAVLIGDNTEEGNSRCGLDIQYPRRQNFDSITKRFFSLEDAAQAHDADGFFRIWTRREAVIKALGGSVADPSVPAVHSDRIVHEGWDLHIRDIEIPGADDLYAAFCYAEKCDEK